MTKLAGLVILALVVGSLLLVPGSVLADTITLAWDPNSEPDLAGYRLYVQEGDDDKGFRLLATIALADIDPQAPHHTIFDLIPDTQYTFTISAYNQAGDESGLSNTVCVINTQQCAVSLSTSNSGCFISALTTPCVLKTPAPAH